MCVLLASCYKPPIDCETAKLHERTHFVGPPPGSCKRTDLNSKLNNGQWVEVADHVECSGKIGYIQEVADAITLSNNLCTSLRHKIVCIEH